MKRVLEILGSLRLTLALLVALGAFFLVGLAIPQKQVLQRALYEQWRAESPTTVALLEAAGLTDAYRSPIALVLWAAFFANLAVVLATRARGTVERTRIDRPVPDPGSAPGFGPPRLLALRPGATLAEVRGWFAARRYAIHEGDGRLRAVRHRWAPAASLAFHLSFFLVAAGGVTSFLTRFEGNVDLGEGETYTGRLDQYAAPPRLPRVGAPPEIPFVVESVRPEVEGKVPVAITVLVRDAALRQHAIEVNGPWKEGDTAFVFKNLGIAPLLVVRDPEGREVFGGYLRLDVLQGKTQDFKLLGQTFTAEFFPDHLEENGVETTRSQELRDPVLRLTVTARSGKQVRASLRPGQSMQLGPYTLTFAAFRYWVRIYVRSERGLGLVWLGFALGALALVGRLVLYRREYVVGPGPGGALAIAGRSEYYRALFADEALEVGDALERALGANRAA
jgi:hypothetical protein